MEIMMNKLNKTLVAILIAASFTSNVNAVELIEFQAGQPAVAAEVNANFAIIDAKTAANKSKDVVQDTSIAAMGDSLQQNSLAITDNETTSANNLTEIDLLKLLLKPMFIEDANGVRVGEVITLGSGQSFKQRTATVPVDSANTAIIHLEDLGLITDFNMYSGFFAQNASLAYETNDCTGQAYALADNVLLPYLNFATKGVVAGFSTAFGGGSEEILYVAKSTPLQSIVINSVKYSPNNSCDDGTNAAFDGANIDVYATSSISAVDFGTLSAYRKAIQSDALLNVVTGFGIEAVKYQKPYRLNK